MPQETARRSQTVKARMAVCLDGAVDYVSDAQPQKAKAATCQRKKQLRNVLLQHRPVRSIRHVSDVPLLFVQGIVTLGKVLQEMWTPA